MTGLADRRSRNRVRAVHEVDADAEAPFHDGVSFHQFESNVLVVDMAR